MLCLINLTYLFKKNYNNSLKTYKSVKKLKLNKNMLNKI